MGPLATAVRPVEASATSIEVAFLKAGEGLGRSLTDLDTLTRCLKDLTSEIADPAVAGAVATLDRVSGILKDISARIPVDTDSLASLNDVSYVLGSQLSALLNKIRMLIVLGRSARIQASVVGHGGADFVAFAHEIVGFAQNTQAEINACLTIHANLTMALRSALNAHLELGRTYGHRLLALSEELCDALAPIEASRERNFGILADLSAMSEKIAGAARMAIMSLQSGDAVRQRLEHVRFGIGLVEGLGGEEGDRRPTEAMVAAMCHLATAQLQATAQILEDDLRVASTAFNALLGDADTLIALGEDCVRASDGRADNAFDVFQSRVGRATQDVGMCEAARRHVTNLMGSLQTDLDKLGKAVDRLNAAISDVVLIGINAGLKAGRLGQDGRSLVVVANDLKSIAATISLDAAGLLSTLRELSGHANELQDRPDLGHDGSVVADLEGVVAALRTSAGKVAAVLRQVQTGGGEVRTAIARVRSDFSRMMGIPATLLEAEAVLAAHRDDLWSSGIAQDEGQDFVDEKMVPVYTMAEERQIHFDTFGTSPEPPRETADPDLEFLL